MTSRRFVSLPAALLAATMALGTGSAGADAQPLGQSAGLDGCISENGNWDCTESAGLHGAFGVAVSKDGRNAYVAAIDGNTLAVLARDKATGGLHEIGCVSYDGSGGRCAESPTVFRPISVTVSPDGRNVYVASYQRDPASVASITVFAREPRTGMLAQLPGTQGCVTEDGNGGACTDGVALRGTTSITASNDGKHVYVASYESRAIAVFARNRDTGALTQLAGLGGCVSEDGTGGACADGVALRGPSQVLVTKDGRRLYVASYSSGAVAAFARDKTTGALTQLPGTQACISDDGTGGLCTDGDALSSASALAITPDGKHVYVVSPATAEVAVLARDKRTGALSQPAPPYGCIGETGSGGLCADGYALRNPHGIAAADNATVYVTSRDANAVAFLARDAKTGALTQAPSPWGCIGEDDGEGTCDVGRALRGPRVIVPSSDGKHVYAATQGSHAVAVLRRAE